MIVKYEWLWLEESVAITELEPHKVIISTFMIKHSKIYINILVGK